VAENAFNEELCLRLLERGRALGVRLGFWTVTDKYSARRPDTLCPWPFERLYVSSDMRVVPCCTIANPQVIDLGDAADLVAVWHSEAYETFRRDHREGRIPQACQGCYRDDAPLTSRP
jgi:pyrroloquinoline quinone biosynthesis protein E